LRDALYKKTSYLINLPLSIYAYIIYIYIILVFIYLYSYYNAVTLRYVVKKNYAGSRGTAKER